MLHHGCAMHTQRLHVRQAEAADLPAIMDVYHAAQEMMIRTGNPTQWGRKNPPEELVREDIRRGVCHVVTDGGGRICGVFACILGEDKTYRSIEDGSWPNDEPYATIHRIAGDGTEHGVFQTALEFCKGRSANIRIDTHRDNKVMQSLIERNGFLRCGIIHIADGTERIAYQLVQAAGSDSRTPASPRS